MLRTSFAVSLLLAVATPAVALGEATLRGSSSSMVRQNQVARELDYTFLRSPGQVDRFVDEGYLVPVEGNGDFQVARGVSYPFARPQLVTFLERIAAQYREACGEPLVVTSLTRPVSEQPGNAHPLSVHPAGMAVDFRISSRAACREWLEATLLSLEQKELLDVTRERRPPHYHVAVFPDRYAEYVAKLDAEDDSVRVVAAPVIAAPSALRPAVGAPTVAAAERGVDRRPPYGPAAVLLLLATTLVAGRRRRRAEAADRD